MASRLAFPGEALLPAGKALRAAWGEAMRQRGEAHDARPDRRAAWAAVALATAYVLWEVRFPLILRDTTTTFAELGMHLHEPAFLRDHLLGQGRLTGWSPSFFGGAPFGTFYFPFAPLPALLLGVVMPYNIAFKLGAASGLIALPVSAYAFGRLMDRDRLTSACLAVATLPFLLLPTTALGGSIPATLSSEYPYSIAMALSLLGIGLAGRGLRTGRHRALTAGALAVALLFHTVPTGMALVGIAVLVLLHPSRAAIRWALPVGAASLAVAGFALVPFVLRQRYAGGPIYAHSAVADNVLLGSFGPVVIVAFVGAIVAIWRFVSQRDRLGLFFVVMAVIAIVACAVTPTGRLWNARFLPFWYLWACLLAGLAIAQLAGYVDQARREQARGRPLTSPNAARLAAPFVALVAVGVFWDSPVAKGLAVDARYDVSHLSTLAFQGYEQSADRAEFRDFIATVRRVAKDHGCGRAHWEWNVVPDPAHPKWDDPRTGLPTLLPYWTDECISSMQGLFIQASPTDLAVSLANGHLASHGQPYDYQLSTNKLDVAAGVADLRVLGVRYYLASSPEAQAQADATPGLRLLDETGQHGAWKWKVYEVESATVVEPLRSLPVVVPGASGSIGRWRSLSAQWFGTGDGRSVPLTDGGPADWPRQARGSSPFPSHSPVGPAEVSNVRLGTDSVSFHVDRTGAPVLVKVGYFPNWKATGAKGPWRATPNFMVVVPTANDVTLRYGRSGAENLGWLVTLAGLAALALLARAKPVAMPEPAPPAAASTNIRSAATRPRQARAGGQRSQKKKRR
jgi:hypothetical protein